MMYSETYDVLLHTRDGTIPDTMQEAAGPQRPSPIPLPSLCGGQANGRILRRCKNLRVRLRGERNIFSDLGR